MSEVQRNVVFAAPYSTQVESQSICSPKADELLVRTEFSAVSAGSELLFYRGQVPTGLAVDATIPTLASQPSDYPIRYGYACVGIVQETGAAVSRKWLNSRVFAFHPHSSHFTIPAADVYSVPSRLKAEHAVLLPSMETAVSFIMDGRPMIGETVALFGLGVVGLLTSVLLDQHPLARLACIDPLALRRSTVERLAASGVVHSSSPQENDFDLVYELTGNPDVLDQAIAAAGFAGRVIVGSWYGEKLASLRLGGEFHRNRIRLLSSQVSTIDPTLQGRWSKQRRLEAVWRMLASLDVDALISHRIPIERAAEAYRLLDKTPQNCLQILFTYS